MAGDPLTAYPQASYRLRRGVAVRWKRCRFVASAVGSGAPDTVFDDWESGLSNASRAPGLLMPSVGGVVADATPWFKFFPRDWLSGYRCRMLSPAERGAYIDLLALQWTQGSIPTDDELHDWLTSQGYDVENLRLGRLVSLFPDGQNERLAQERDAIRKRRKRLSEAGKKGARVRWGSDNDLDSPAIATPMATPMRSHSNIDVEVETEVEEDSSVVTQPAEADVENHNGRPGERDSHGERWNDRLAPLARKAGGDPKVADWLRRAKRDPDYYERVLIGLVNLRDCGALDFVVEPGEKMSPAILAVKSEGQPIEKRAIAEYWRMQNTERSGGGPERVQA